MLLHRPHAAHAPARMVEANVVPQLVEQRSHVRRGGAPGALGDVTARRRGGGQAARAIDGPRRHCRGMSSTYGHSTQGITAVSA